MVKGVNKTVIEVNDTGSRMFEKIVFYISPAYGKLNAKQLRRAVDDFSFQFDKGNKLQKKSLRKRMIKRRRIFLAAAILGTALILGGIIFLIL